MPFKKGQSGNPSGRKAGTPNKLTSVAKSAIEHAALGLGGAERLTAWAKEDPQNERVFWSQIYTKLLPLQVEGDGLQRGPMTVIFEAPPIIPGSKNQT